MKSQALEQVAQRLEANGHDPGELHALQEELDLLEQPPSLWGRLTQNVRDYAARQWALLAGELEESREAMTLIRRAMQDRSSISEDERLFVRNQLLDMFRMLPAGTVIFVNATMPLPASSLLTPALLKRLGLVPSRWQEAHLVSHLQDEVHRLRTQGLDEEAFEVAQICAEIETEGRCRREMARDLRLLPFWDANEDGQWDAEERAAYLQTCDAVIRQLQEGSDLRCWFLLEEDVVIGPVRRSQLPSFEEAGQLLICRDRDRKWVSLAAVLQGLGG